jgi:starvation-inducible outer membrane lipoprotein
MKKAAFFLLFSVTLMLAACSTFTAQIGMKEQKWLRNTTASDLVYIEGHVKAYRSAGSYYYFKDGVLAKVTQSLLPAEKI